mmetsp:Transcript_16935/g.50203  ORF Transcript_16935/g.50203 Transcript_16935/m.50203 type:complete len:211 (+) Transcript_16935:1042-1674(+)
MTQSTRVAWAQSEGVTVNAEARRYVGVPAPGSQRVIRQAFLMRSKRRVLRRGVPPTAPSSSGWCSTGPTSTQLPLRAQSCRARASSGPASPAHLFSARVSRTPQSAKSSARRTLCGMERAWPSPRSVSAGSFAPPSAAPTSAARASLASTLMEARSASRHWTTRWSSTRLSAARRWSVRASTECARSSSTRRLQTCATPRYAARSCATPC